jgi:hypothetical protein
MSRNDPVFHPTDRVLRQFAAAWLACCGLLMWRAGLPWAPALAASVIGVFGLVRPRMTRWLFVGLTLATKPIGWVVSRAVLGVIYFGVFTPVALVFKAVGRDALKLKARHAESYWSARPTVAEPSRFFHQF